jgi:hypothetical protein
MFIAFKCTEADSSLYPPLKKTTPTNDGTAVLDNAKSVLCATTSGATY